MTILAGAKVDAADLTAYICKATQGTTQSIANATFVALQFNGTDDVDTLSIHDPVTNNSRFVIGLKLGWWKVSGLYATTATTTGKDRRARILLNGAGVNGGYRATPIFAATASQAMTGGFWTVETQTMVQATVATDYVELHVYQDTGAGGALSTTVSGDLRCQFLAEYVCP